MHIHTSDQEPLELGFGNYTCNWGTHICGLYETEKERDEIVFGFLRSGAIVGDLQLYVPVERTAQEFVEQYGAICPECREHVHDTTCFQLLSAKDLYYPDGEFSPARMDQGARSVLHGKSAIGQEEHPSHCGNGLGAPGHTGHRASHGL